MIIYEQLSVWKVMAKIFHAARCSDGQLRITDFNTDFYGRVEICSNQRFETFSYYHWSIENAEVACRELGYNRTLIKKENMYYCASKASL